MFILAFSGIHEILLLIPRADPGNHPRSFQCAGGVHHGSSYGSRSHGGSQGSKDEVRCFIQTSTCVLGY